MEQIYKYPQTHQIKSSKNQPSDEDLNTIPLSGAENFLSLFRAGLLYAQVAYFR